MIVEWGVSLEECNIQQRQGETVDPAGSQRGSDWVQVRPNDITSYFNIFTCSKPDLFKTKVVNQEAVPRQ